jgi:hypothetical protein
MPLIRGQPKLQNTRDKTIASYLRSEGMVCFVHCWGVVLQTCSPFFSAGADMYHYHRFMWRLGVSFTASRLDRRLRFSRFEKGVCCLFSMMLHIVDRR